MKPSKRCLTCLLMVVLLISTVTPLTASALTDVPFSGTPWCHTMIYAEDDLVTPSTIIIYLHGDGHNGYTKESLEFFTFADHPLKYAREDELPLPDDCVMICFQGHGDGDFRSRSDQLCEVIHAIAESCPDSKIILAGHSHGCLAAYKIAATGNTDIDGYVFISGVKPGESEDLSLIPNCFVMFGTEGWVAKRSDYSVLFREVDISDAEYGKDSYYVEETTNNVYAMVSKLGHSNAPKIFQEDIFWEWVSNVTPIDAE